MPSLPQRTQVFADRLNAISREGGNVVESRLGGTSHLVALQLGEAVSDIQAAGRALAAAHRRAIPVYRNPQRWAGRAVPTTEGQAILPQTPELQAVSVLMKAWLFFVRAFCDHAYRLLLADAENRPAPRGGSMDSIVNANNPVAVILTTHAPGVPEWFHNLREVRNEMKEGAAFAFSQLDARGLGLTIFEIRTRKNPLPEIEVIKRKTVTFGDVVDDAARVLELLRVLDTSRAGGP